MEPEKWQKVKSIFNDVIDLDPEDQESFLASTGADKEILAEVRQMLSADDESLIQHSPFSKLSEEAANALPEKIGHYKVLREVGRGGMGIVYEAVRDDGEFSQRAAIKIIKRGMDSDDILRRFRNERQILAELQHSNIARLLDGGVTESGSPYYVMEFIEGPPIDVYCREKDLGVREKLELFRQVCAAVSYAHSQLIVHRDLKPSNIIVTADGAVKLLDFGIAKVLTADGPDALGTATQLGMMTPAYASPEQIRGEKVTTASDVYSLGVIFYELLTGDRPYHTDGKSIAEVVELVCNSELRRPSDATSAGPAKPEIEAISPKLKAQGRLFKGDLDNIALKALQRDTARRYQSVEQFSEDIRRHLIGQPVSARADTASYRFKKFISRNRGPAFAGSLIFISLCIGIGVALWQARRAEQERARAENRFAEVRELANSVIFKYHDAIAALPGSTGAREMLVRDATRYLDNLAKEAEENPQLQRELALAYIKLGDVLGKAYAANVGDTAGASDSYRKAVALLESAVNSDRSDATLKADLVKGYIALFEIYMRTSHPDKPVALQKALAAQEELLATDPGNPSYRLQMANLLLLSGDATGIKFADKIPLFEKALAMGNELYSNDPQNQEHIRFVMRINQRLATNHVWMGNDAIGKENDPSAAQALYAKALPYSEKSLEMAEILYKLDPLNNSYRRNYAMGSTNMAEVYAKNGRRADAMNLIAGSLEIFRQMEIEDPRNKENKLDISFARESIADVWEYLGEFNQAIQEREKSLSIQEGIWKEDTSNGEAISSCSRNHLVLIRLYERVGNKERAAFHNEQKEELRSAVEKLRAKPAN